MQYPLISEYVRAIQDAESNLDSLSHLVPVLDDHGEPYRSGGAFAVVFKMKDEQTGKYYALKCFTEEQNGRAEAYQQIADELEFIDSPYLTSVKYLDKELFVDCSCEDEEFPVLLMDWVEGETMETYIANNYTNSYDMGMLCYRFCKMAAWLRSQPFAHGDIKPDNIIVHPDGSLTLVDYDGMYVPAMKGQKSPTIGTRDFSHPLRSVNDFDETIDDFALASIALSLKAISLKPSLLDDYGASDRLLFSTDDYRDLSNSKVLGAMQELANDDDMKSLLAMFLLVCAQKNLAMCSFRLFMLAKPDGNLEELMSLAGKDYHKVFTMYPEASAKGSLYVLAYLGYSYCIGYGVEKNIKKGLALIKKTAERRNSMGQVLLGKCYELGRGVEENYTEAANWYRKSAEQGNDFAQFLLGKCYELGQGVEKNYVEAVNWFRRAAIQGNPELQRKLGDIYYQGQCGEKNYAEAVIWYRKAAEQGDTDSQWNLGKCYELGQGVEKNYAEAINWFRKTAEQGSAYWQRRLGDFYYYGQSDGHTTGIRFGESHELDQGVEKNYVEAVKWYRKAAEQGDTDSQIQLGKCYASGRGVEKNYAEAASWYRKVAGRLSFGKKKIYAIRLLTDLEKKMSL